MPVVVALYSGIVDSFSLPPWPTAPPTYGKVKLRAVSDRDVEMARELSTDPYVPQVGSLPPNASRDEAFAWVERQKSRHSQGTGFSFAIADATTGDPVGHCGLWLKELTMGRATAGYSIVPSARRQGYAGDALAALTDFGWTLPGLFRVALYIEPWNTGSIRTAECAGYLREGLLRSHQEIAGERRDMLLFAAIRPTP
jgi:RimJ/RimL family protein N-acetyltransferase